MSSKYVKGERITSLDFLTSQDFVYLNHKVYCRGWFMGWHIGNVYQWVCQGRIYKAIPKETKENENG